MFNKPSPFPDEKSTQGKSSKIPWFYTKRLDKQK